jgi:hypothetical protein
MRFGHLMELACSASGMCFVSQLSCAKEGERLMVERDNVSGFESVGNILSDVLKEVSRRAELRPRLEAELGRLLSDEEFIRIAERTGARI